MSAGEPTVNDGYGPTTSSNCNLDRPDLDSNPTHGLTYSNAFISSLPVLSPPTASTSGPIYALSSSRFSEIHLKYMLRHAPDSTLFPFLHGLEDGGEALRLFFGSSSSNEGGTKGSIKLPNFRGLLWVACDEPEAFHSSTNSRSGLGPGLGGYEHGYGYPYDDEEEDDYDSEEFEGEDFDMEMDVDGERGSASENGYKRGHGHTQKDEGHIHMHPIHHRHLSSSPPSQTETSTTIYTTGPSPSQPSNESSQTSQTQTLSHDRRASTTSQSTTSSYAHSLSSSLSGVSSVPTSISSDSPPGSPCYAPGEAPSPLAQSHNQVDFPQTGYIPSNQPSPFSNSASPQPPPSLYSEPTYLTSTFFAKELLRPRVVQGRAEGQKEGEVEYEFTPPKIPEGISLRNFGVQVPIYATLSDIVVYSPTGNTGNALALAEKFREAVAKKLHERKQILGETSKDLVTYNVFVLDSSPDDIRRELLYLMMRRDDEVLAEEDDSVVGQFNGKPNGTAHTDGTDAHVMGEMDLDVEESPAVPLSENTEQQTTKSKRKMLKANTIDFAAREKEEMRDLTKASEIFSCIPSSPPPEEGKMGSDEQRARASASNTQSYWDPNVGQIFLGNSNDLPLASEFQPCHADPHSRSSSHPSRHASHIEHVEERQQEEEDLFDFTDNDPARGFGYDICIQCHDAAPFPTAAHLRAAEDHLMALDGIWAERSGECSASGSYSAVTMDGESEGPSPRPPPNANAVIHLPFPSSPPATAVSVSAIAPFVAFLERFLQPVVPPDSPSPYGSPPCASQSPLQQQQHSPSSSDSSTYSISPRTHRTRPVKVLIHSADGYTESSVLALCLLMALRKLTLPQAYLELQVEKKRSFFVYQTDLGVLRRLESRFEKERQAASVSVSEKGGPVGAGAVEVMNSCPPRVSASSYSSRILNGRPAANSVSISTTAVSFPCDPSDETQSAGPNLSSSSPSLTVMAPWNNRQGSPIRRPRASTSPALPIFVPGHEAWFNDPRFDGSFPSRVLPFLYLGNLNHASNAYMLHALGITHVVSVGECALVPPPNIAHNSTPAENASRLAAGKAPGYQGSLWIEEREGRIKVLDIKGVCDDGIDTLAPQLEPICEWIEKARAEGGNVLVHCRVGVSRSATVTIAYVMKYLALPLVDAYLIVRSRRLSVLIQPNMRLLYNLLGWEVKLALERAANDEEKLRNELARSLNWPYLAREVHALNEKYLH